MTSQRRGKIDELLADRALVGLSREEATELARLMAEEGLGDDATLDLAAAALAMAGGRAHAEDPLPPHLAERVERAAREYVSTGAPPRTVPTDIAPSRDARSTTAAGAQVVVVPRGADATVRPDWTRWGGWFAAAAAACIFVGQRAAPRPENLAAAGAADSRTIAIDADLRGGDGHARGALAWSDAAGRGDLRVRGLPTGDYELWIDDAGRGERSPLAAGTLHAVTGAEAHGVVAPAIAPQRATQLRVLASTGRDAPLLTVSFVPH